VSGEKWIAARLSRQRRASARARLVRCTTAPWLHEGNELVRRERPEPDCRAWTSRSIPRSGLELPDIVTRFEVITEANARLRSRDRSRARRRASSRRPVGVVHEQGHGLARHGSEQRTRAHRRLSDVGDSSGSTRAASSGTMLARIPRRDR